MRTVDANPRNPLRTYTFRVRWADVAEPFAGVRKVSGLAMDVEAHEVNGGGNTLHPYLNPDRASWEPIVLEQGLALDRQLHDWAAATIAWLHTGQVPGTTPVKRNVVIEVWDPHVPGPPQGAATAPDVPSGGTPVSPPAGRRVAYEVVNAWVSRFRAVPALDAMSNEVGLLMVELTHEGWRETTAASPPEPTAPSPT